MALPLQPVAPRPTCGGGLLEMTLPFLCRPPQSFEPDCALVPGTIPDEAPRFVGRSSAPPRTDRVCMPG